MEILLSMKIDVKSEEVRKVGIKIFRRRKIGITHQHIWIGRFGYINQLTKKFANALGAVPTYDLWRNLVTHQISEHRGMVFTRTDSAGDSVTNFCPSTRRIEERDMLCPGYSHDHPETIGCSLIKERTWRRSKGAKTIHSELRHQRKIKLKCRSLRKGSAVT